MNELLDYFSRIHDADREYMASEYASIESDVLAEWGMYYPYPERLSHVLKDGLIAENPLSSGRYYITQAGGVKIGRYDIVMPFGTFDESEKEK